MESNDQPASTGMAALSGIMDAMISSRRGCGRILATARSLPSVTTDHRRRESDYLFV
jgi:hypothetical protein